MIIFIDASTTWTSSTHIYGEKKKPLRKLSIGAKPLQRDKEHLRMSTASILVSEGTQDDFQDWKQGKEVLLRHSYLILCWKS